MTDFATPILRGKGDGLFGVFLVVTEGDGLTLTFYRYARAQVCMRQFAEKCDTATPCDT